MDVPEGVTKVVDGRLYVRRQDGSWELFWPRSEAEERAGRRLTSLEVRVSSHLRGREVGGDPRQGGQSSGS